MQEHAADHPIDGGSEEIMKDLAARQLGW